MLIRDRVVQSWRGLQDGSLPVYLSPARHIPRERIWMVEGKRNRFMISGAENLQHCISTVLPMHSLFQKLSLKRSFFSKTRQIWRLRSLCKLRAMRKKDAYVRYSLRSDVVILSNSQLQAQRSAVISLSDRQIFWILFPSGKESSIFSSFQTITIWYRLINWPCVLQWSHHFIQ